MVIVDSRINDADFYARAFICVISMYGACADAFHAPRVIKFIINGVYGIVKVNGCDMRIAG
jgi:disulfide bond formation protein DsbB